MTLDDLLRSLACRRRMRWLYRCFCLITFRVSRRRREMYSGHARLSVCVSVCLSAAACPHYCTDRDVTWRSGRDASQLCAIGRICNRCTGCVAMAT